MLDLLGQSFFLNAVLGGTLVGLICSFMGVYVLLRRVVFLGIALAQLASAGVALALLLGWHPLVTALSVTLGGALAFSQIRWRGRAPVEAGLGASYVLAAALGTVFIAKNPVGEARALSALFGNILAIPALELAALAIVAIGVLVVHLQFRKEFAFVSFDYETAAAHGVNARLWELLLYLTLGVAIAFAIRSAGVLVTFALLVVPALGARLLARSLGAMFSWATGLGTLSVPIGLAAAFALDLPTGATITLTVALIIAAVVTARGLARRISGAGCARTVGVLLLAPAIAVASPLGAWIPPVMLAAGTAIIFALTAGPATAQPAPTAVDRELRELRRSVEELRGIVEEQKRLIDELRARSQGDSPRPTPAGPVPPAPPPAPAAQIPPSPAPPPSPPSPDPPGRQAPAAEAPTPAERRGLPPWLALLPEIRLEGNFIGNYTFNPSNASTLERQLGEEQEGQEFFVRRNRLNVREIELGLRSAVDPFARFEAIFSAEQEFDGDLSVDIEEAILTLGALPGRIEAKIGKFRTGFGEFNDSDPEEIPEVDPPNVISNVFGQDGDGWIDTGVLASRRFGLTDRLSLMLHGAVFNGDNETSFNGGGPGVGSHPVWYGRLESFLEIDAATGLEAGIGFAQGKALDDDGRATLRSQIFNAHLQLEHKAPLLALFRGVNLLSEFFYTWRQQQIDDDAAIETIGRWGLYTLIDVPITRRWSVGARFDYSQLPTLAEGAPSVREETAGSLIVSFRPSRFFTLRAQYKHTERNFALTSDEILLQALFKIGYERPGPF
jgi:ABC-type Mn2+/Zn2+ transport system permease subunit